MKRNLFWLVFSVLFLAAIFAGCGTTERGRKPQEQAEAARPEDGSNPRQAGVTGPEAASPQVQANESPQEFVWGRTNRKLDQKIDNLQKQVNEIKPEGIDELQGQIDGIIADIAEHDRRIKELEEKEQPEPLLPPPPPTPTPITDNSTLMPVTKDLLERLRLTESLDKYQFYLFGSFMLEKNHASPVNRLGSNGTPIIGTEVITETIKFNDQLGGQIRGITTRGGETVLHLSFDDANLGSHLSFSPRAGDANGFFYLDHTRRDNSKGVEKGFLDYGGTQHTVTFGSGNQPYLLIRLIPSNTIKVDPPRVASGVKPTSGPSVNPVPVQQRGPVNILPNGFLQQP
jgi:hypothetical protein